ncbi:MAG: FKBP-type peptidyl-prolyl cis-trans isomerase [Pseudomonadota bacterium]
MKIADQCVVSIHYTLTDQQGEELDSSKGQEPLTYLHGSQGLIPGLERELEGREPGEQFEATVQPEEAYGSVNPELIQDVPLEVLDGIENLHVGMALQSRAPDGRVQNLKVDAIGEETATLNANHPLAGEVLHFDVSVEDVREASPEELEHGHSH